MDTTTAILVGAALFGLWKNQGEHHSTQPPKPPMAVEQRQNPAEGEGRGLGHVGNLDAPEEEPFDRVPQELVWLASLIGEANPNLHQNTVVEVTLAMAHASGEAAVPLPILTAMVQVESNFNPYARSASGAIGLGQLMPLTANELGVSDPYDPFQNALGAASYLKSAHDRYPDDPDAWELALASYRIGPGAVQRASNDRTTLFSDPTVAAYLARFRTAYQPISGYP